MRPEDDLTAPHPERRERRKRAKPNGPGGGGAGEGDPDERAAKDEEHDAVVGNARPAPGDDAGGEAARGGSGRPPDDRGDAGAGPGGDVRAKGRAETEGGEKDDAAEGGEEERGKGGAKDGRVGSKVVDPAGRGSLSPSKARGKPRRGRKPLLDISKPRKPPAAPLPAGARG